MSLVVAVQCQTAAGDSGGAVFYAETGLLAGITIEADSQCMKIAK
jgi:hypothetical protein